MWVYYGAEAPDNIWVFESHPNRDLLVKRLATTKCVNVPVGREGELYTFSMLLRPSFPSLAATFTTLIYTFLGSGEKLF